MMIQKMSWISIDATATAEEEEDKKNENDDSLAQHCCSCYC